MAMTLPETGDAFALRLQAIFADEARAHLARLDAGLAALSAAGAGGQAALRAALLETLHTLKGAAHSIGLDALAYLCDALESVTAARAALAPAHIARLRSALPLAGLLLAPPDGRLRNQAMALIAQLEALARELAAAPSSPAGAA